MRYGLLCDELDNITHSYDYGIVPGSAAVFVKDELNNIGRLDLTLLEGVMIVVEVSEEGYKYYVASCSPLSNTGSAVITTQIVQKNLEIPFETMDNLLMAVSPMFCERFQQSVHIENQQCHQLQQSESNNQLSNTNQLLFLPPPSSPPSNHYNILHKNISTNQNTSLFIQQKPQHTSLLIQPASSLLQSHQQQQQQLDLNHAISQDVLDDLHNWIR